MTTIRKDQVKNIAVTTSDTQTLTNKLLESPLFQGLIDGWVSANETWTYASATTITVPSGAINKYQKGDKIKLTQGTNTKYFYIVGVTSTVLTITGGSDYTLTNSAISNNYYSKVENPQGFPQWFNHNGTWGGTSSMTFVATSNNEQRFRIVGKTCILCVFGQGAVGGTPTSTITLTLPLTSSNHYFGGGAGVGATLSAGAWFIQPSTSIVNFRQYNASVFSAGNTQVRAIVEYTFV